MRFAAIALLFVAAVSYGEEVETVDSLITMAAGAGAPFTAAALERMNNADLWGAKRGKRSVDIVIINTSGTSFESGTPKCGYRSLVSPGLEPENHLDGHTSTVLGLQSGEDNEYGYVNCLLSYYYGQERSPFFNIQVVPKNIRGDIGVSTEESSDIYGNVSVHEGEITQVIIKVEDRSGGPLVMRSQQGGSLAPQMQLKGSSNLFVKASKRGRSVRTI